MTLRALRFTLSLLFLPAVALAQNGVMTGIVRDSASGRPLGGTLVTLAGNGYQQSVAAEQNGTFRFTKAFPANYTLSARRLGYAPSSTSIHVDENAKQFTVSLSRLGSLDTIRVTPGTGIYGEVGFVRTLKPLGNVDIQIIGVGTRLKTDARGRFFLPLRNPGTYLVRTHMPGYESQAISVIVKKDETVEVMMLLDSQSAKPTNAYEMAWSEFGDRARLRGSQSALVSRGELLQNGDVSLIEALERATSVAEKHLRFGSTVCVFVDGRPAAATPIQSVNLDAIEAVEVYTSNPRSDETHTLARASRGYECHETGILNTVAPENDLIRWVVIWLKR